jgi:hypothetical protein
MGVTTACELGAAHLDASFGLADGHVRQAEGALDAERHLFAATGDHQLGGVAVADSRLDPSGQPALRRHHVQERESGMVDGAGRISQGVATFAGQHRRSSPTCCTSCGKVQ